MVAGNAGGALLVFLWVRRYLAALLQRSDYLPADRYVARSALKGETT